jgi:two-component system CheB/CheR fusion protein
MENPEAEKDQQAIREEWETLFPVVAIGASAGGLQALSAFLKNVSPNLGMAYVVIQHLSPNYESILPELLEKQTEMQVHKVENGMHIKADNVYVIPPNTYMSITDSKLTLSPRSNTNGIHHSIDFFLNAFAPLYQTKAIAVILSGSGNDGTAGIQSVKANGGITFAQDDSASFLSMPKMASDSGFTDFVMSCENIAKELSEMVKRPHGILTLNNVAEVNESELKKIQQLLHQKKDVDFGYYKQTTINRRILRRVGLNKSKNLAQYTKLLRENPEELNLLYKDLLINVTSFFREPNVYEALTKKVFPQILRDKSENEVIRIWTPACATGEEAYSIAITLYDYLKERSLRTPIQIFGTDLNEAAIEKARIGVYAKSSLEHVSPQRLKTYFTQTENSYQIIKPIRDCCIFATHNLLKDPPFSRMDLISCQNVMIYLENNPQRKILQAFHYSLRPSGFLLLGKSETIGNLTELFAQADKELKIYTKKATSQTSHLFDFAFGNYQISGTPLHEEKRAALQTSQMDINKETDKLLLEKYVPASVVINKDMQILRFNGATSNYLQPSSGKASLHLLKMVKDELVFELKGLISKAKKDGKTSKTEQITLANNKGETTQVDLEVVPIKSSEKDIYYLIIFNEHTRPFSKDQHQNDGKKQKADSKDELIKKLEDQVNEAREYMKNMSEEFEATREELQSANEEVLSSNEELQSINEELETSKEELQSTNEELTTINEELQRRNFDLREMSDYLTAIIETINEPILVINEDTRIRSANKAFYKIFKTKPEVIEGNFLSETSNGLWNIPMLKEHVYNAINQNTRFENIEITGQFTYLGEKTFLINGMVLPYDDGKKNKILLIIEDITNRKKAEAYLKANEEKLRLLVENASDIITIYSKDAIIIFQSESVFKSLGYTANENSGKSIYGINILHPDDLALQQKTFEEALKNPGINIKVILRMKHKNESYRTMEAIFRNLFDIASINGIVANYHDITDNNTKIIA